MGWRERKPEETYSDEEVEARLKEALPHTGILKTAGFVANTKPVAGKGH